MEEHWSTQKETGGGFWQFRIFLGAFRFFGPQFAAVLTRPIVFFIYIFDSRRRRYSREFLHKAGVKRPRSRRHFQAFASSLIDKMAGWAGILKMKDLIVSKDYRRLCDDIREGRGVLALCSHLGNIEIFRALGNMAAPDEESLPDLRILAIVEFDGTGNFNEMLQYLEGSSMSGIIPVSLIGPDTMVQLQDFIDSGGMVVVAGDRTSPTKGGRYLELPFLGETARFPYGTYHLADLLGAPVYTIFTLRENVLSLKSRYRCEVHQAPITMGGGRKGRDERISKLAHFFIRRLEILAKTHPYQWFNFYSFWGKDNG